MIPVYQEDPVHRVEEEDTIEIYVVKAQHDLLVEIAEKLLSPNPTDAVRLLFYHRKILHLPNRVEDS